MLTETLTLLFAMLIGSVAGWTFGAARYRVIAQRDYFLGRRDEREGRPIPPPNKPMGAWDGKVR